MVGDWHRFEADPGLAAWARAALPLAIEALHNSEEPRRCGGTWDVGLDLLPNEPDGSIGGVAFPWAALGLTPQPLHRAQLSTVYPGYPQPSDEETEAAYRFRLTRDAAHLDGLLAIGPDRQRMVKEPHGWILGIPLNDCSADAAPLVAWQGSANILRAALLAAFGDSPPEQWGDIDVTAAYTAARRQIFETCPRVELPTRPGEATLMHRLTLHGVAPWAKGATAPAEGRIIAYFRPVMGSVQEWVGV
ncbi:hypothetical protein [Fuscibacter oryzae]|uniref:Phytanoyl-CoA dioxygenase n=1 Tax=Fuscibacter oryzae TaxID=2803939 RepID=A0A8J7MVN1_9RHOB|nr:hypothetical protein [Fuscibacter oryzae]MBL4929378.1 hypothetical protein [Fuscibacter oryzae]